MSLMPPMNGGPPEAPPEETAPQSATPEIDAAVEALLGAAVAGANKASTSDDPEAFMRFGQGAFAFAQAVKELLTPPADPVKIAQTKAEADMVKAGAQLAHDETKSEADRAATNNGSGSGSNMRGKDGH